MEKLLSELSEWKSRSRLCRSRLLPRSHHTHAQASRATVAMARRLRCSRRAAVSGKSEKLRGASKNYVSQARYLNTQALLRKYAPLAVVLLLVLGMLWWRFR